MVLFLVLAASGPLPAQPVDVTHPRVMSLNLCTDQLVLALADPEQIVSLSELSVDPTLSSGHAAANRFPRNRGVAEEVLAARPEIVVTGTYSLHNTTDLLKRLGIAVETFDYAQTLASIPASIRRMGVIIDRPERAEAAAEAFEADMKRLSRPSAPDAPAVVVYGQNGVAVGAGTLADSVLRAGGFRNQAAERGVAGMAPYPLELLVADRPDAVLLSSPLSDAPSLADQIAVHPALDHLAAIRHVDIVPTGSWDCGGPQTIAALAAIRALRDGLDDGPGQGSHAP